MTQHQNHKPKALKSAFINGMSRLASSVCVVTTDGPFGRAGLTATSVTSVSADGNAPTLLVCINRNSGCYETLIRNRALCVNVLSADQQFVSDVFAGRTNATQAQRFENVNWQVMVSGAPALSDALVAFDCHLSVVQPIGTHDVIFAEVQDVATFKQDEPLLYTARRYATLAAA